MGLFKRTKILPTLSIIFIATTFLFLTPLLSSSLKSFSSTNYLVYLIINVLIITLGADAGLLSPSSPSNNKTPHHHHQQQQPQEIDDEKSINDNDDDDHHVREEIHNNEKKHKCLDEKMMCPNMPPKTIFFIGSDENEEVKEVEVEVEVEVKEVIDEEKMVSEDDNEEEELFVKAEVFIGNFYKQLKMQREESWNRIHGFYSNGYS